MSSFRNFSIARWAGLVGAIAFASPVLAANYTAELGVDQNFEYDDNIDFGPQIETEASVYTLIPSFGLDGRGERWLLGLDLSTPFQRFSEARLDSDNQDLNLTSNRTLQRGSLGFDGRILRDSTHTIDEAGTTTRFSERRVLDSFNGHWQRRVGQRHEITLSGGGQKVLNDADLNCTVDYRCRGSARLNDYDYASLQIDWTRALTDRMATQLSLFTTRFEAAQPPDISLRGRLYTNGEPIPPLSVPDTRADTVGLQGGVTRVFNERLQGQFMLGWRSVDLTTPFWDPNCVFFFGLCFIPLGNPFLDESQDTSSGELASAGIDYKGERLELGVSLSRRLTPSGLSTLLETDELATTFSYRVRERLQLRLTATALNSRGKTNVVVAPDVVETSKYDREYYRLRPHLRWSFLRDWWLDAGFEVRSQDLLNFGATEPSAASSHSVFVTLGYRTEPFAVFR